MRVVHGRLAAVSVRASFGAGLWVGLTIGLVIGAVLGALFVWAADTTLGWQRDLAFTLGVGRTLLPLGDQAELLRLAVARWYLVIPIASLAVGAFVALVGGFIGALLAAAYNRSPRHASVVVELPDDGLEPDRPLEDAASDA